MDRIVASIKKVLTASNWTLVAIGLGTSITALAQIKTPAPSPVLGILIKFKSEIQKDKKVLTLQIQNLTIQAKAHRLKEGSYFSVLGIQHYVLSKPTAQTQVLDELKAFCDQIQQEQASRVEYCELDQKLRPDAQSDLRESCSRDASGICLPDAKALQKLVVSKPLAQVVQKLEPECNLHEPAPPGYQVPVAGLSPYWAQEYTGADLLRKKMLQDPLVKTPRVKVEVLDTNHNSHQEYVRHLISGDQESAPLPLPLVGFADSWSQGDYISSVVAFVQDKLESGDYPHYINSSMGWGDSAAFYGGVKILVDHRAVFVTSADNDGFNQPIDPMKQEAARKLNVIVVGSMSYTGMPSSFSQSGENAVTISAPTNDEILSFSDSGHPKAFSGTSGAAPQVTAALAAFTQITGYPLSGEESKALLQKTAVKTLSSYYAGLKQGAGMLNDYLIGEVAYRIREKCKEKDQSCIRRAIKQQETFEFAPSDLNQAKGVFEECFAPQSTEQPLAMISVSCKNQRSAYDQIRAEALLHSEKKELWQALSCIESKRQGLNQNAHFYAVLGSSQSGSSLMDSIELSLSDGSKTPVFDDQEILKFVLPESIAKDHPEWMEKLLSKSTVTVDDDALLNALLQPMGEKHPEWVEILFARGTADSKISAYILSQPRWSNHPEWVERLLKRGVVKDVYMFFLLNAPHWQNHPHFKELLAGKPLTVQNLRDALKQKSDAKSSP